MRPRGQHARGLLGYLLFGLRNESIEAFAGMRTADWDLDFPEGCVQLSSPVYVDCRPSSNGKVIFRSFHASFSDSSPGIQPTFGVKIFIYGCQSRMRRCLCCNLAPQSRERRTALGGLVPQPCCPIPAFQSKHFLGLISVNDLPYKIDGLRLTRFELATTAGLQGKIIVVAMAYPGSPYAPPPVRMAAV